MDSIFFCDHTADRQAWDSFRLKSRNCSKKAVNFLIMQVEVNKKIHENFVRQYIWHNFSRLNKTRGHL